MLPDWKIRDLGEGLLTPFDPDRINPASIDVTLSDLFRVPIQYIVENSAYKPIKLDLKRLFPGHTKLLKRPSITLNHGDFILASTVEKLTLPNDLVARIEGKSSLGRLGLAVHITAGFIDPGFEGEVTLEIANLSPHTIKLYAGMPIAQIAFEVMDGVPDKPYQGRYQGQTGPTESRFNAFDKGLPGKSGNT